MAGFDNTIVFAGGERLTPSSAQDIIRMQDVATSSARINHTGSPEGAVAANPSSLSHDPVSGAVYRKATGTGNTGWLPVGTSSTDYHVAKFIVGDTTNGANYADLATAMAAVSAGDTIAFQPGTYSIGTQAWTPNVNLVAFNADAFTPNVTLVGKLTISTAGTVSASGIRFQTNADNFLAVTGAAATIVNLNDCYLNCSDATGITFSSSSASAAVNLSYCSGNLGTTLIKLFDHSSAGGLSINYCKISNTGASVTDSTASAGFLYLFYSYFNISMTTSGTNSFQDRQCHHNLSETGSGITALTIGGSGANFIRGSTVTSGNASAISIGGTLLCNGINVSSNNTNAIVGAGTIQYDAIHFSNSSNITTTTQTPLYIGPSAYVGSGNSGNANILLVDNTSNTASSRALCLARVAGATAGDAFFQASVNGVTDWAWGADNSDSDAWVLANTGTLGTGNVMRVATSGEVTFPLQSAFSAYRGATSTDVTGDGTTLTVPFDTEIFDVNSDFASNTYTCPVTSKVQLNFSVLLQGATAAMSPNFALVTSNNSYNNNNFATMLAGNNQYNYSVLADMDAGDTASITVVVAGGAKVVDIYGFPGDPRTIFNGYIAC